MRQDWSSTETANHSPKTLKLCAAKAFVLDEHNACHETQEIAKLAKVFTTLTAAWCKADVISTG